MYKKLLSAMRPLFKSLFLLGLVMTLALGHADGALAAPGGGYYPGGGGFGFPFLIPFWGIGGGFSGLFTILLFLAIANFLTQAFRRVGSGEIDEVGYSSNPPVSVTQLQVGLLAEGRSLQTELNRIAETADTNSPEGRTEVLQEASLALLRHPEYWVYAGSTTQQARLGSAEAEFNRLALGERSKFTAETLSNVNNQLKAATPTGALPAAQNGGELDNPTRLITEGPGPGEKLLAIEVLWTPQAEGDTLTSDDLMAEYADLKLV